MIFSTLKQRFISSDNLILLLTILTIPLTGMAIDIFVPSLPTIAHFYGVGASSAKLAVGLYLIGYGISQLAMGILSDRYGRRQFLLWGLATFALASVCATQAVTINQFLFARLIQGLSIGAPAVISRAIITDCFTGERIPKNTNHLVTAWSLGVIVAPLIGSYLQVHFNWQASFYFLALYSAIIWALCFSLLPETHRFRGNHSLIQLVGLMGRVFKHRVYIAYTIAMALIYSIITLFHVIGPFLIQNVLHYDVTSYGRIALLMGGFWFAGSLLNQHIVKYFNRYRIMQVGSVILVAISMIMLLIAEHQLSLWGIIIPLYLLLLVGVIVFVNAFGICMSLFPELGGISGAVMGALFITGAGLSSTLGSNIVSSSAVPLAVSFLGFTFFVMLAVWLFREDKTA